MTNWLYTKNQNTRQNHVHHCTRFCFKASKSCTLACKILDHNCLSDQRWLLGARAYKYHVIFCYTMKPNRHARMGSGKWGGGGGGICSISGHTHFIIHIHLWPSMRVGDILQILRLSKLLMRDGGEDCTVCFAGCMLLAQGCTFTRLVTSE